MNRSRRSKNCFMFICLALFTWIYLFTNISAPEDKARWMGVNSGPSWTLRQLRSQENQDLLFQEDDSHIQDDEYYNELTKEDVMDIIGDKIVEMQMVQKARNGVLSEIWNEPDNSIAVMKAKSDRLEGKHDTSTHNMTIWTMGFSIAEIYDIQNVIRPFGVKIIDRSLSSLCAYTNSCASQTMPSLDRTRLFPLHYKQRRDFLQYYVKTPEVQNASAILCVYPVHLCDLMYRTGKPVIFLTSNRYELGKSELWAHWNYVIQIIKSAKASTIAARDNYDAKYMDYFTQSHPITLERHCGYVDSYYAPIGNRILLYPGPDETLIRTLHNILKSNLQLNNTKKSFQLVSAVVSPLTLKQYRAIVYIPYKVSSLKFTEIYRMNIPLFLPSIKLLVAWEQEYHILKDRVFPNSTNKYETGGSKLGGKFPLPPGSSDPNTFKGDGLIYWFNYLEYFALPGVEYFSSTLDLVNKLRNLNILSQRSHEMQKHNEKKLNEIGNKWFEIITKLRKHLKEPQTVVKLHTKRISGGSMSSKYL